MEKFRQWVINNNTWYIVLTSGIMMIYLAFLLMTDAAPWLLAFVFFFYFYLVILYPEYCRMMWMNKAILELNNQCDPYPLLKATETLLSYKNSAVRQQVILINHAVALRDSGEYQKVYEILRGIQIEQNAKLPVANKVAYYNNLADICTILNKYEEANVWYAKMMQIYSVMKENKLKSSLESVVLMAENWNQFRAGEYSEVVKTLRRVKPTCLRQDVGICMLCGVAYLHMGETERAKEQLQVVAEKGNRLREVIDAKILLENINTMKENGI